MVLVIYVGLIGMAGVRVRAHADRLHPGQDQGYLITVVQLPPGSTLDADRSGGQAGDRHHPDTPGIEHVAPFAGLDATTFTIASNSGTIFSGLPSLYNHQPPGVTANSCWPTCASACR